MKNQNVSPETIEEIYEIHRNVKKLREKHGLTTKQFAKIIDIKEKKLMLSETCTEVNCFYAHHIKNICDRFKIKVDDLFKKDLYQ